MPNYEDNEYTPDYYEGLINDAERAEVEREKRENQRANEIHALVDLWADPVRLDEDRNIDLPEGI